MTRIAIWFAVWTGLAVIGSGWLVTRGGLLALLLPPALLAIAGWIAGLSIREVLARSAAALGTALGGFLSMLAIVSTQGWSGLGAAVPGLGVAFAASWGFAGLCEAAILYEKMPLDRAARRTSFFVVVGTFGLSGAIGGALCGLGLMIGSARDPAVICLLLLGFVVPNAAGAVALASVVGVKRSAGSTGTNA